MSYISHINKFTDAQAIQDALNAGTLKNPYVAMTPVGVLDYNTLEPTPVLKIAGQSIPGTSAGGGVYQWNNLLSYSGTSFTIEVLNTPITATEWDYTEESKDQCGNPGTPVSDTGTSMSVFEANSGYIEVVEYYRADNLVSYSSMDDHTSSDPAVICACQGGCWDGETCQECDPYDEQYLTIEALEDGELTLQSSSVYYSINGGEWTLGTTISVSNGDEIRFKSDNGGSYLFSDNTLAFNVYGNIESLEYGDNFVGQTSTNAHSLPSLFGYCTGLVDASNLVLPATTLANACYQGMFDGCTSLTAAPALPATTLADSCYRYMFQGCTSLTTAPELPATTLAPYCYESMFRSCTSLNYIKCLATNTSAMECTTNWVNGVASTGDFYYAGGADWAESSVDGIPSGWTSHPIAQEPEIDD